MIGFYALGGGFGHLSRVRTFIDQLQLHESFKVITTNERAYSLFKREEVLFINPSQNLDKKSLQLQVDQILTNHRFQEVYLDVFPFGILGELDIQQYPYIQWNYLGRRLLWKNYQVYLQHPISINKAYLFEPLEEEHQQFITNAAKEAIPFTFQYNKEVSAIPSILTTFDKPVWLIVHTSKEEELSLLFQHAKDIALLEKKAPQWVVLSDKTFVTSDDIVFLSDENPKNWYPHVEKIITAAGFNSMHELKSYAHKHICLPFVRKYDDQFWRKRYFLGEG